MEKALEFEGELCSEKGADLPFSRILADFRAILFVAEKSIKFSIAKLVVLVKSNLFLFNSSRDNARFNSNHYDFALSILLALVMFAARHGLGEKSQMILKNLAALRLNFS